jgi:tetratricopeptide (TPR) repeat protein
VASHLSNLANSFSRLERHEAAFDYCRQALLIDAGLGNRRGALIHAGNMSTVYLLWGQAAEALACLTYAIYLDDRLAHSRELARHLTNIAAAHLLTGQLARAERVCRLAMALQQKLAIDFELCWAYLVQGRLFLAQEQFGDAVGALERASDAAAASNRSDVQFEAGVLLPRARWLAGEVDELEAAIQQLQAMLDAGPTPHQKAAITYERWLLDKNLDSQAQAKTAYDAQLQQTPTAEARQRAIELGVTYLPPMPAPPPLPALIREVAIGLESLLESVRERLGLPA